MEWLISTAGLAAKWMLSERRRAGWVISFFVNLAFVWIFWADGRYGLMPMSAAYAFICVRGWFKWGE